MATNLLVWLNIQTRSDTMLGAGFVLCSGFFYLNVARPMVLL
jgi:hypothetical protein